jgi:tetratricopeptide (TPR) repeat protein
MSDYVENLKDLLIKGKLNELILTLDKNKSFFEQIGDLDTWMWFVYIEQKVLEESGDYSLGSKTLQERKEFLYSHFDKETDIPKLIRLAISSLEMRLFLITGRLENIEEIININNVLIKDYSRENYQRKWMGEYFLILGSIYDYQGEATKALGVAQLSLNLFKTLGENYGLSEAYLLLGNIYLEIGNYKESMENFNRSLAIWEKHENKRNMAKVLNNFGIIYFNLTDFDKATNFFHESLSIADSFKLNYLKAHILTNLSFIAYIKNDINNSIDLNLKALKEYEGLDIVDNNNIMYSLYNLVFLGVNEGNKELTKSSFEKLSNIEKKVHNPDFIFLKKLAKALILKNKTRMRYKVEAQKILEELLKDKKNRSEKNTILLWLCELNILEMLISNDPQILAETNEYVKIISQNAIKMQNKIGIIESQILNAQLSQLTGNLKESKNQFENALKIAEENNMKFYIPVIKGKIHKFSREEKKWEDIIYEKMPFNKRLEESDFLEYIQEAQKFLR